MSEFVTSNRARNAAASYVDFWLGESDSLAVAIRAGEKDEFPLVEIFSRFEREILETERGICATKEARECLENVLSLLTAKEMEGQ